MPLTTTLARILQCGHCADTMRSLVHHLGPDWADDAPIPLTAILDACGLDDAIWCLRAADGGADVAAEFAADAATVAAGAAHADAARAASYASHAAGSAFYATRADSDDYYAAGAASHAAHTASYAAAAAARDAAAERRRQADYLRRLIA